MQQKRLSGRLPPKRTLSKQKAVRHLLHAACRMIASGEDPFAIQLIVQSADKIMIDLAKKMGRKLPFTWTEFVRSEYRRAVMETIRETANFLKHADLDHNQELHVGDIATSNFLQLALCIVNYHGLFDEWTDHMRLLFNLAKVVSPKSLVHPEQRDDFDSMLPKLQNMTLREYLSDWWDDPIAQTILPNLLKEKADDLQDILPLYNTKIKDLIGEEND